MEPRRYRFLFLNGSNARGYEMFLANRADDTIIKDSQTVGRPHVSTDELYTRAL